jgi:hypothetical protein
VGPPSASRKWSLEVMNAGSDDCYGRVATCIEREKTARVGLGAWGLGGGGAQRGFEVVPEVFDVLDADGEADEGVADAEGLAVFGGD